MPNITDFNEQQRRFVEDVARLLVPWGVPLTAARLYGYLLLSSEPVSLDRMMADLEMSKSTASVAARLLEQYTLVRRRGERGSKRVLYEVSENYESMLLEQNRLIEAMAELLSKGSKITPSRATRDRLREMSDFYLVSRDAMQATLQRWRSRGAKPKS